jgi:hypothetical protein
MCLAVKIGLGVQKLFLNVKKIGVCVSLGRLGTSWVNLALLQAASSGSEALHDT